MSAPRASETADTANTFLDRAARTVLLPGSPATYANRAVLHGMGLRWDPVGHRWHGTTTAEAVKTLREQLGLEVRCFGTLEPPRGPSPPRPPAPTATPVRAVTSTREPASRSHDGSRTRAEARTVYRADEEVGVANSRFSERDITSGLPDDSREDDEREEERRLRDLRGRVKRARAIVAATPRLAETLAGDWKRAARFYTKHGIAEGMLGNGVVGDSVDSESTDTT